MPFVNVKLIEGFFGADQKREIVEHLAETMVGSRARTCAR
jgi:phenylpyruvate tautomerase PptA (4-oxalocrotonate tautomerase family)